MTRLKLLFLICAGCIHLAFGQSRTPEIKISPRETEKYEKMDSLERSTLERPYFLLIEQSEQALEEGDYAAAALRLVEAMSVEPDNELNVALLSNLGMIYFYNEQDSMALVVLDKAIGREPRLIAPRQGRARVLVGNGRDKEAYIEYENILNIDSLNVEARFLHAMMSLNMGKLEAAETDIRMLERTVPGSKSTMLAKGTMYSLTGNEQDAISIFRKLIENEPAPEYYARLAACHIALDQLGDASMVIGDWLSKYPTDGEAFYYRAILNKRRYLNDDAQIDAKMAIKNGVPPQRMLEALK